MQADRIIQRARQLVGIPFRLHGRDLATGIDCVGLVAIALNRAADAPAGYAMRNSLEPRWAALLDALLARRNGQTQAGDVVLLAAGPATYHLGIWTGSGLIHADANLGRVVELPGEFPWPLVASWHEIEED